MIDQLASASCQTSLLAGPLAGPELSLSGDDESGGGGGRNANSSKLTAVAKSASAKNVASAAPIPVAGAPAAAAAARTPAPAPRPGGVTMRGEQHAVALRRRSSTADGSGYGGSGGHGDSAGSGGGRGGTSGARSGSSGSSTAPGSAARVVGAVAPKGPSRVPSVSAADRLRILLPGACRDDGDDDGDDEADNGGCSSVSLLSLSENLCTKGVGTVGEATQCERVTVGGGGGGAGDNNGCGRGAANGADAGGAGHAGSKSSADSHSGGGGGGGDGGGNSGAASYADGLGGSFASQGGNSAGDGHSGRRLIGRVLSGSSAGSIASVISNYTPFQHDGTESGIHVPDGGCWIAAGCANDSSPSASLEGSDEGDDSDRNGGGSDNGRNGNNRYRCGKASPPPLWPSRQARHLSSGLGSASTSPTVAATTTASLPSARSPATGGVGVASSPNSRRRGSTATPQAGRADAPSSRSPAPARQSASSPQTAVAAAAATASALTGPAARAPPPGWPATAATTEVAEAARWSTRRQLHICLLRPAATRVRGPQIHAPCRRREASSTPGRRPHRSRLLERQR
ncbi:unnamed protein product [Phaeothamnion confervicola]